MLIALGWILLAIVLDVIANVLLKYSQGFTRLWPSLVSLLCVFAAFTALAQAIKDIPLTLAYALWGGMGILATAIAGAILFQQSLLAKAYLGLLLLMIGMGLLKFAA